MDNVDLVAWMQYRAHDIAEALKPILSGTRFSVCIQEIGTRFRAVARIQGADTYDADRLLEIHRVMSRACVHVDFTRVVGYKR